MKNTGRVRSALRGGVLLLLLVLIVSAPFVTAQTAAPNWTQLSPTGGPPSARNVHSAVYDPGTNRMTVFGGNEGAFKNDVWVLTNANGLGGTPTWFQQTPAGAPPSARIGHTAIYDPATNRMTIFGGFDGVSRRNDVWVLTNANGLGGTPTWTQLLPTGGPPSARHEQSAAYSPAANRMTIFGGLDDVSLRNDVWVLTNANGLGGTPTWTQLLPTGGPPSGRYVHSAVYDPATNRMTIFGGLDGPFRRNDVWVLTNASGLGETPTWTQLTPTGGPPSGRQTSAVYDPVSNRMTIFGGFDGVSLRNDVWVLTNANGLGGTPTWTQLLPTGGPPSARLRQSAAYSPAANRMTIFGGLDGGGSLRNDVWVLTNANGIVVITVQIDIEPRKFPNRINLHSGGHVTVAILTTPSFNAATVNVNTVLFAGAAAFRSALEDVDRDGDLDLVLRFAERALNLTCASTQATLTGQTTTGTPIQGTDSVRIVRDKANQRCP